MGLHPTGSGSNKLEREFHNGVGQRQCPHGGTSVPQWPSPVAHVVRVSSSCLLPPQEPLQDQQMGLTQDFFKWLLLCWVLECVEFCVCSLFPTALVLLKVSPTGLHSQMSGDSSSQCRASGLGSQCGALAPCSLGSSSAVVNYSFSPFGGCPPRGVVLTALHLIPLTVLLWFPCIFSCRRSFLLVFCFVSFSLIVFL